jgi:hypothetical protein
VLGARIPVLAKFRELGERGDLALGARGYRTCTVQYTGRRLSRKLDGELGELSELGELGKLGEISELANSSSSSSAEQGGVWGWG